MLLEAAPSGVFGVLQQSCSMCLQVGCGASFQSGTGCTPLTSPPAPSSFFLFHTREEPERTAASHCEAAAWKQRGVSPHLYADIAQRPVDKSSRLALKWFKATTGSSGAHQGFV